ncbi:MAG: TIGR00282 family metallophosphoesterase [Acidobacteria bacterium]|nr:MAG: TIGR00282 family metallophosphoesterase [Acidobacteriota bacterium]REK03102.1 MAG: TIGR00282 family metallophosphoesterase [Acidobacteriota bacterium]REK15450.1 MAG: TIGR00282 family metallophosphoesterase [Acidobacteriota bacterium]REK45801.1 MAG: TIGR00282 family metallophosphoesterase [Acidobacteriota bacterium]
MRILFIGDVVARSGRRAVLNHVSSLRTEHAVDAVLMNAENVAGGFSITPPIAKELFEAGIDLMTSGNHIFDKKEVVPYIRKQPKLIRPANYPPGTPGAGCFEGEIAGRKIAVINLLGRVFMPPVDDPFRSVDECLSMLDPESKIRIVDMHCEATSEKYAMGWHLDGRVSLVVGTHTHVPTADERILENGTAYVTDLGMTGSYAGVIGMNKEDVLKRFTIMPHDRAGHSKGSVWICYIVVEIDDETGKALTIERFRKEVN